MMIGFCSLRVFLQRSDIPFTRLYHAVLLSRDVAAFKASLTMVCASSRMR